MTSHAKPPAGSDPNKKRTARIVTLYPLVTLLISVLINYFAFGINQIVVSVPSIEIVTSLAIAVALLVINHTCLMTSTELVRVRYGLRATPEDGNQAEDSPIEPSREALQALERRHSAHRNTTENIVYFALLVGVFILISPPTLCAQIWIIGFALSRLGHTYSYLAGNSDLRGIFMTLSLVAMYGMTSYIALSIFV